MRKGFTLVELMIVVSILAIMATILVGIINPIAQIQKASDARRKKDLGRIRVAFEEYYNDKGCYPSGALLIQLQDKNNCSTNITGFTQLSPWVCDQVTGLPYGVTVESETACPKWFRVFAELENTKDAAIPAGWASRIGVHLGNGQYTNINYNFGVSSTNVFWYDQVFDPRCDIGGKSRGCRWIDNNVCKSAGEGYSSHCEGDNCYAGSDIDSGCAAVCKVSKCPLP